MPSQKSLEGGKILSTIKWTKRTVNIPSPTGTKTMTVDAPETWSDTSVAIVTGSYLAPRGETSVAAMLDRVVNKITEWAAPDNAEQYADQLYDLVLFQKASFNSPVWFNLGVAGRAQAAAACYILDVEDDLPSILDWVKTEGLIFQTGAGSGVNLSKLRASTEQLSAGGTSSGPVSFMRGADASAGTIKSGGSTRRAAKIVMLNVDHPDIEEFIWCKAIEERKARTLTDAGYEVGLGGKDSFSLQYQNANNSVRVTDEFMDCVLSDTDFTLKARRDGEAVRKVRARTLLHSIAEAAWECGDPGVQFHDTINKANTTPISGGEITSSNPCGETHLPPFQSCNLASINLPKYIAPDGRLDITGLVHDVGVLVVAMDAIAGYAEYPTEQIAANARRHRPLGIGFTGLGELLMLSGLPYDSAGARDYAGAIAHLITSAAWVQSAELAAEIAPFDGWEVDKSAALAVLGRHAASCRQVHDVAESSGITRAVWEKAAGLADAALAVAVRSGVRNSQVTAVAPTGTISFMLGAATTGIEPAYSLATSKRLVDGRVINTTLGCVEPALRQLGYSENVVCDAIEAIEGGGDLTGIVKPHHLPVFATAAGGTNVISPDAHVHMLAAVQAGISQGVSKTVNLPADATVEDVQRVIVTAYITGCKAISIYRDASKVSQPLTNGNSKNPVAVVPPAKPAPGKRVDGSLTGAVGHESTGGRRHKLPATRPAVTHTVHVGGNSLYITLGYNPDGSPGEMFLRVARAGSTLAGLLDTLAVTTSIALQYGAPLADILEHWRGTHFAPAGPTGDSAMPMATSLADAIAQRLTTSEISQPALMPDQPIYSSPEPIAATKNTPAVVTLDAASAPICSCGALMVRTGTCWACPSCGASGGCG